MIFRRVLKDIPSDEQHALWQLLNAPSSRDFFVSVLRRLEQEQLGLMTPAGMAHDELAQFVTIYREYQTTIELMKELLELERELKARFTGETS